MLNMQPDRVDETLSDVCHIPALTAVVDWWEQSTHELYRGDRFEQDMVWPGQCLTFLDRLHDDNEKNMAQYVSWLVRLFVMYHTNV